MAAEPEPQTSDRGFRHFEPIVGSTIDALTGDTVPTRQTVRVYESSAAMGPHIWLAVEDADVTKPGKGYAHLNLDAATRLRDQLTWMIEHHYQLPEAP